MKELSQHLLDIMMNSVEAGASLIELTVDEDSISDRMILTVKDNGRGMTEEMSKKVLDPFVTSRTTRKVGLGLPLFSAAAQQCGGDFVLQSKLGVGTTITATFIRSHIDRAPIGDIATAIEAIILSGKNIDLLYTHRISAQIYQFDTREIRSELGENIPLSNLQVLEWITQNIRDGEQSLPR